MPTFLLLVVCSSGKGQLFASGNAFYNWFKKCAIKAGMQVQLDPHGLRKAVAGCTSSEIQVITGHNTLSEVERYSREANQKLLVESTWKKLGSMRLELPDNGKKNKGSKNINIFLTSFLHVA